MPFHYFFPVPRLERDVADHTHGVELLAWLLGEHQPVKAGQPVARVQTRWAILELLATGDGVLGKHIFDPRTYVKEGDPIAVIFADGEALPYGRAPSSYRVAESSR